MFKRAIPSLVLLLLGLFCFSPDGSSKSVATRRIHFRAEPLLLDQTYTDGISVGLSVARKLRTAYSGSAFRVRRDSDNIEQDIGFTGNPPVTDQSSLLSFVGANNGYVVTVYGQSASARNATQGTSTKQPLIVSSGVAVTDSDGNLTMYFDGTDDELTITSYSQVIPVTMFMLIDPDTWTNVDGLYTGSAAALSCILFQGGGVGTPGVQLYTGSTFAAGQNFPLDTVSVLQTVWRTSGNTLENIRDNLSAGTATAGTITNPGGWAIGRQQGNFGNIRVAEIIILDGDDSTDRTTLRDGINSFYSVY